MIIVCLFLTAWWWYFPSPGYPVFSSWNNSSMHEGLAKGDRCPTVTHPCCSGRTHRVTEVNFWGQTGNEKRLPLLDRIDVSQNCYHLPSGYVRVAVQTATYQSFTNIDLQCYVKLCSSTCRKFCIMTRRLIDLRELLSFQKERT